MRARGKIENNLPEVTLFQAGFATPLATVFAIVNTVIYLYHMKKQAA